MADITQATIDAFVSTFPGLDVLRTPHTTWYFFDPEKSLPHDRRQPFSTVVSADDHDQVSKLSRPGVFRLNIGVSRATYRSLFGLEPKWGPGGGPVETGHDFSALDEFLPHPIYAPLSWICILNPATNWPRAQEYLREAHEVAKSRLRPRSS